MYGHWQTLLAGKIRWMEGKLNITARIIAGLVGTAALWTYLIWPEGILWALVPLPDLIRWSGAATGALGVAMLAWVHRALGRNFADANYLLFEAYANKGLHAEAVAAYTRQKQLDGAPASEVDAFTRAFAQDSWPGFLRHRIGALEAQAEPDSDEIASLSARAGDLDRAFSWLEKSYARRSAKLTHLKVDARFDNLRSDLRFTELLRRIELTA